MVGALHYLGFTRLDIAFTVHCVSKFMHQPKDNHWQSVKRILRYLKFTVGYALHFHNNSYHSLQGFSDEDWAADKLEPTVLLKEKDIEPANTAVSQIVPANVYLHKPEFLSEIFKDYGQTDHWYFFIPRDRRYRNGSCPSRSANGGYWKATGADKSIINSYGKLIGFKKSLVFYRGKPPNGVKTN
ncbi:hypothetical protein F2P56_009006 [Juglans regia]|uniref:NAC domain-containing protein 2-like n=2 Tax=Juglans regia TaxID=51240 RepID=A0A2I4DFD5_JUGRE|nr:NAC domain-containing protein 2-like [Juglans regia]KAF5472272.1 hypothetical protein F2P56_009006 [Juglans regia]